MIFIYLVCRNFLVVLCGMFFALAGLYSDFIFGNFIGLINCLNLLFLMFCVSKCNNCYTPLWVLWGGFYSLNRAANLTVANGIYEH